MIMIKRYSDFLNEKIIVSNTDIPSVVNYINQTNELENHIKEFNSKKTNLENIYNQDLDEIQLIEQLKRGGFILATTNKKDMKFENPILGKYAQVCDLKKQVNELTKKMGDVDTKMKEKELQLKENPSDGVNVAEEKKSIMTEKEDIKKRLDSIKAEADRQEREVMVYLKEIETDFNKGKKNIAQSRVTLSKASNK